MLVDNLGYYVLWFISKHSQIPHPSPPPKKKQNTNSDHVLGICEYKNGTRLGAKAGGLELAIELITLF